MHIWRGRHKTKPGKQQSEAHCGDNMTDSVNRLEEPLQGQAAHLALLTLEHAKLRVERHFIFKGVESEAPVSSLTFNAAAAAGYYNRTRLTSRSHHHN